MPSNHFVLSQIVEEVKLALFVSVERMTLIKDSTPQSKYLALEEETVTVLNERLDALKILPNVHHHEESEADIETRAMTVEVVKSVFNLIESHSLSMENSAKISTALHAVASEIKALASPKSLEQNPPCASSSNCSHLKGKLYLQLPPDFPLKASQTILKVLLRGEHSIDAEEGMTCQPNSLPLTTPKHLELSYIVSVDSVTLEIVVTILECLALMPGCSEEIVSFSAMDIFRRVHTQVKQFMALSKSTVVEHKTKPLKHSTENDVTTTCTNKVILQIYHAYRSNRLKVEQMKTTLDRESKLSVVDSVMFQLNELANTNRSSSHVLQSSSEDKKFPNFDDSHEVTKKVLSPEFQSMAHRKVIEVVSEFDTLREEANLGHVDSFAADVVETVVECLQDLSRILETVNSVYAHRIYQNVQNKIRDLIIKQGKDMCTSSSKMRDDLKLIERGHPPQEVACSQSPGKGSPLPSVEKLHPVESHREISHVDIVSYTKEVIREVVTLFVLEEIERQRSELVYGIPTPLEIKMAIIRILSQIEDPEDEFSMQGYVGSSTSLSMISLSAESMKTLSSKDFKLKATHAVSDVLLKERGRTVFPEFLMAATSDRNQTSQTCRMCSTMEPVWNHVSSITQSAIHLLQKSQTHQGGSTMNASRPSHLHQTLQDKVKAFFNLTQGKVPKKESKTKLGNQSEVLSLSVKPSPKQNVDKLDLTTEFNSVPASQYIGRRSLSPDELHPDKTNEKEEGTGSCMKEVFRKVLTLYIHEAKIKEKKDVNPVNDDLINEFVDSIQSYLESASSSYSSTSYYVPEKTLCERILCGHNCQHKEQRSESSLSSSKVLSLSSESFKTLASEEFQTKANELVNEILNERLEHESFASSSYLTSSYLTSSMDQASKVTVTVIDTLKTLLCCTPPFLRAETSADYLEEGQSSDVPSIQGKIKEFFSRHKKSSMCSGSEVDGGASIIGTSKLVKGSETGLSKQGSSSRNAMPDGTACQPCPATTAEDGIDLEQMVDVDKAVAKLDQFISSEEVNTFSRDLACKLVCLLKEKTNQRLNFLADVESSLECSGNDEMDKSVSLTDAYMFVEESVKGFLHKLLYPSCPCKVRDPDDFIQAAPRSNACKAMAPHESCSGHSTPPTHALGETVDLVKDLLVNQVMETLVPVVAENKVECVLNPAIKDATCSTSSLGLIIGSHTDSVNKFRRPKAKTEVKVCIKPKVKTLRINKKVKLFLLNKT